jgi:hypothetical protein
MNYIYIYVPLIILGFVLLFALFISLNKSNNEIKHITLVKPNEFRDYTIDKKVSYLVEIIKGKYEPTIIDNIMAVIPADQFVSVSNQVNKIIITDSLSFNEKAKILTNLQNINSPDANTFYKLLSSNEQDSVANQSLFFSTHNIQKNLEDSNFINPGW